MFRDDGGHTAVAAATAALTIGEVISWGLSMLGTLLIGLIVADEASEALERVSVPTIAPQWNTASAVDAQAVLIAAMTNAQAVAKAEAEAIPTTSPSPTVIYRYHASKNENLSPRPRRDYDVLSFSTQPPRPGVSACDITEVFIMEPSDLKPTIKEMVPPKPLDVEDSIA